MQLGSNESEVQLGSGGLGLFVCSGNSPRENTAPANIKMKKLWNTPNLANLGTFLDPYLYTLFLSFKNIKNVYVYTYGLV